MWRTNKYNKVVIIGLPTIIKLLSGEEVKIEAQNLLLLPDDVLSNARKRWDWNQAGCPEESLVRAEETKRVLIAGHAWDCDKTLGEKCNCGGEPEEKKEEHEL